MTFFLPTDHTADKGPGTIASAIAIGTNRPNGVNAAFSLSIVWLVIVFAVAVTIYHAYGSQAPWPGSLVEEGTSVVTRLSAFLLLCIGVQIMINGVVEVAQTIHNGGSR
jgi:multiple antibiotic resistance protein